MNDLQKWLKRAPGVLTFFMVIGLGATLANLLWMVLTPPPAVAEAASLKVSNQEASTQQQDNYGKIIADQHIFGEIPKAAPVEVKAPTPVPQETKPVVTNLNLKLHGIIASNSGSGGFAMISYNGKTQEVYRKGEAIPKKEAEKERELDGVIVKSIADKLVVIDNNGTEQIIELPDLEDPASGGSSSARTSRTPRVITPREPTPPEATENAENLNDDGIPNAANGQAQSLAELREQAIADPSVLMSVITPSIVRKDGAVTGIRVYPSRNRELFRELGLKNGDIITKINDVVIDDPNKGMEVFQQISESPSLTIYIIRGGNEQVLNPQF